MYNNNEYTQPEYESNYEFNPEYESEFENENFENEFEDEYGSNQEYNMEENYEDESDYEDEFNRPVVHDHRSGSRPVIVPTRRGTPYRNTSHFRTPSYRRAGSNYRRPAGSPYRRSQYHGHSWPNNIRSNYNFNSYGSYPYYNWRHRYPQSSYSNNMDQASQYSQDIDTGSPPSVNSGTNVPNYILDTIKNLSQQMAATNANVQAMQQSMQQSMAGTGNQDNSMPPAPPDNTPMGAGTSNASQSPAPDHEMEDYEYDMENEMSNYGGGNELNEMGLAAELLSTNNEMELDHFLGGLLGGKGPLGKLLKGVIKKALPIAGAAAGTFFGGPLGTAVGQQIGSAASNMFELELEGLSNEDQEFEVAKSIVHLANDAAAALAQGNKTGDPHEDAKNALIQSAIHNAPGLLVKKHHHHHHGDSGDEGHWHRRGNRIIIENAF